MPTKDSIQKYSKAYKLTKSPIDRTLYLGKILKYDSAEVVGLSSTRIFAGSVLELVDGET